MSDQENTPNDKDSIPKSYKKPKNANKWLVKNLLQGKRIHTLDAIDNNFWHRLAINVFNLRHKQSWNGIIATDSEGFYFIRPHRMTDAIRLAKIQFNIDFGDTNND
jgi:hypothetical protein